MIAQNKHFFSFRGEEGEVHSKKDFINTARMIAKESEDVVKMARKVADACTDKRMKRVSDSLLRERERREGRERLLRERREGRERVTAS